MICLVSCEQSDPCPSLAVPVSTSTSLPVQTTDQHTTRSQRTALTMPLPPSCHICSYKQPRPETQKKVKHHHDSSRQVRVMMGVEGHYTNPFYMCPSCQAPHLVRPNYGLNVCVSTSMLHNFRYPREQGVVVPPDSTHVDWLTIPGATIRDLSYAWRLDYHKESRPQRVLLVAGLNDLIKGGDFEQFKEQVLQFEEQVVHQNRYHITRRNELIVAPLLNPPKLCWFSDNGRKPPGYNNRQEELHNINTWIKEFNSRNNVVGVPNFQTWGTRSWQDWAGRVRVTHRWNEWRSSEPNEDKLHLCDKMRAKMGKFVVKFFEGELERKGPLI